MKKIILFFGLVLANSSWATEFTFHSPVLTGSGFQICMLGLGETRCWGEAPAVPALKNPIKVTAATNTACALEPEGVKCWTSNKLREDFILPKFNRPQNVFAGSSHGWPIACVLDNDELGCWGIGGRSEPLPALKNPRKVDMDAAVGSADICALDDDGLHCWDLGRDKKATAPVSNPTDFSLGGLSNVCAFGDGGLQCWKFSYGTFEPLQIPDLSNPIQVSSGSATTCAIHDQGLKCWGNEMGQAPALDRPVQVAVASSWACALDAKGVKCWGHKPFAETVPVMERPFAFPYAYVKKSKDSSVVMRYLQEFIGADLEPEFSRESYFAMALLRPAFEAMQPGYPKDTILRSLSRGTSYLNSVFRFSSLEQGLKSLAGLTSMRLLALRSLKAAITLAMDFSDGAGRSVLAEVSLSIARAEGDPSSEALVGKVLEDLDGLSDVKKNLAEAPQSAFLVETMDLAAGLLKEKLK